MFLTNAFNLPSLLTALRFFLTPLMLFFWFSPLSFENEIVKITVVVALYIVATLTDYYDGYYARKLNQQTKLGNFLDPLADKILLLSVFIAALFVESFQLASLFVWLIVLREIGVTLLRLFFISKNEAMATDYHGKLKTVSQIVAQGFLFALLLFNSVIYEAYSLKTVLGKKLVDLSFEEISPYYQAADKLGLPPFFVLSLKWLPSLMLFLAMLITVGSGLLYFYSNRKALFPVLFHGKKNT